MIIEPIYQTLERVANIKDKEARRSALRKLLADKPALALLIQYTYHPDVQWDLPEGKLPDNLYSPSTHDDYSLSYRQIKKLRNFWTNSPVPRQKKEINWVGLVNDLTGKDGELLQYIKDKHLPWKTLNKAFVYKAVPELFPPILQEEVETEDA